MNSEHIKRLKQGAGIWNRWREEHPDIQPDLRHADLSETDLHDVTLSQTDLRDVLFLRSNLHNADLRYADLRDADLSNSNLDGTRFDYANFGNTNLRSVNLSQTLGLHTVKHKSPSYIGGETIILSGGRIPVGFLEAAKVPTSYIESARALLQRPFYHSCFISYSHQDMDFVKKLSRKLFLKGIDCWFDESQLLAGQELSPELVSAIEKNDKFLLCCSQHSFASEWVGRELECAIKKEHRFEMPGKALAVIALDLDGSLFKGKWDNPFSNKVRERVAADFTKALANPAEFDAQVEKLVRALLTEEGRKQQEAALSVKL